jgi:hypothetical protein
MLRLRSCLLASSLSALALLPILAAADLTKGTAPTEPYVVVAGDSLYKLPLGKFPQDTSTWTVLATDISGQTTPVSISGDGTTVFYISSQGNSYSVKAVSHDGTYPRVVYTSPHRIHNVAANESGSEVLITKVAFNPARSQLVKVKVSNGHETEYKTWTADQNVINHPTFPEQGTLDWKGDEALYQREGKVCLFDLNTKTESQLGPGFYPRFETDGFISFVDEGPVGSSIENSISKMDKTGANKQMVIQSRVINKYGLHPLGNEQYIYQQFFELPPVGWNGPVHYASPSYVMGGEEVVVGDVWLPQASR